MSEVPVALGLDFGTESVRALLVSADGVEVGSATAAYEHGQITDRLPGTDKPLPADYALQDPDDWVASAASATREVIAAADIDAARVVGVGVDFTSCTMLPCAADGTPLCRLERFRGVPLAWPKLWKHHGAKSQTERLQRIAEERRESFLKRYGGLIGLEWLQPKMLETIEESPEVADACDCWIEAGDWFVWRLVGGGTPVRSTCQAGYKALWSAEDGYPPNDYFDAVDPRLADAVRTKLPGAMKAPGERAGTLNAETAAAFGLREGTPVATATIDAHAAVPGVGAGGSGTLVMVLGTSSCHMLNAEDGPFVPGVAGVVQGGILPGLYGYETGQAAVGDAFDWLRRLVGEDDFSTLGPKAAELPAGAEGVRCLDWMNGCRTPLMDGGVRGAFAGLSLGTRPEHLYRALLEASGCGVRWIAETLRGHGVPVDRFVATGGLPHHNRDLVRVYADILGEPIEVHPSEQGPALGAAILGMVAAGEAGGFGSLAEAVETMAGVPDGERDVIQPNPIEKPAYDAVYADYRAFADYETGRATDYAART